MDNEIIKTVYVVVWHYHDNSGFGTLAAFVDQDTAERLVLTMSKHNPSVSYRIETTHFFQ